MGSVQSSDVARAISGDGARRTPSEAVETLVANHRELLAFVQRRVGDRATAEDILQEAFVRGLPRVDELRQEESVLAWFYRVLRNGVIDHHRRRASASRTLERWAVELGLREEPVEEVRGALCRCIGSLASTLKDEYAEALRRIEVDGVAVKDFAQEAGISASHAGVRVFRARKALREQVLRACGTCAAHGCENCTCRQAAGGCAPPAEE